MLQMKMSHRGRVVIPVERRQALDLKEGDATSWELHDGKARITTRAQRIRQAQALMRKHVPAGQSLTDELIAEQRAQAADG